MYSAQLTFSCQDIIDSMATRWEAIEAILDAADDTTDIFTRTIHRDQAEEAYPALFSDVFATYTRRDPGPWPYIPSDWARLQGQLLIELFHFPGRYSGIAAHDEQGNTAYLMATGEPEYARAA